VVPTAAVQRGPSGTFVYVVKDDNTASVRRVTVAQQDDREAVIGRGLQVGERVVTTGFARLNDGSEVVATNADAVGQAPPSPDDNGERRERRKGKGKRNQTSGASGSTP
jgi:multidrug efflux system membrane fusion protein